jgi:hypothetical protein
LYRYILAREAAGGRGAGLEEALAAAGAKVLDAALRQSAGAGGSGGGGGGGGSAHTAREALGSLLSTDLTRAAASGRAGAEAYQALLRGHALGYAARHEGFVGGDGGSGSNGHEALAAVLTSLARSKARLEEVEKRHARAAEAAAKRAADVRARLGRLEHEVRAVETISFGAEEDDEARGTAAGAEAARRAAGVREELGDAEAAEARAAADAEAEKAALLAAMRSQFRREWSTHPRIPGSRGAIAAAAAAAAAATVAAAAAAAAATSTPTRAPAPAPNASPGATPATPAAAVSPGGGGGDARAPDTSATCKAGLYKFANPVDPQLERRLVTQPSNL